jgi:hypothetical protein
LTWRAVLALPLLSFFLEYAFEHNDVILLPVAVGGLGLIGLSVVLVLGLALWLKLRKQRDSDTPLNFEAGFPFQTGYSLGFLHWIPLLKFNVAWERPVGAKVELVVNRGKLREEVTAEERTQAHWIVRRLTVTDVFGLARFWVRRRQEQALTVKPNSGQVNQFQLVAQHVNGDEMGHPEGKAGGDLIEMRPYAPGDPLKLVLWKVYARTGRMLVRMPETAISPTQRTLAYLVAAEGDEPAAGIARAVLENGSLGTDYLFGADGGSEPTRVISDAIHMVVGSINHRPHGGGGLDSFLVDGESRGVTACILFVPSRPGPWLDRVAEQLARHPGPFRAIVGVDSIQPPASRQGLNRVLFRREKTDGSRAEEVRAVYQRLQAAGAEVTVLNRRTGETTPPTNI